MDSLTSYGEAWQWLLRSLQDVYPEKELKAIAREVFLHLFKMGPAERVMGQQLPFSESQGEMLASVVHQLKRQKPLQYLTGIAHFCDLEFKVNEKVLIPRPETEELVHWILDSVVEKFGNKQAGIRLLDVGTGSGCIPVSLARTLPNAAIQACDVSEEALEVASHNALKYNVKVDFFPCDILRGDPSPDPLDVVVSNPPYVMEKEKRLMQPNVLDHEPHSALFVPDDDPLIFYRTIASKAFQWLNPGGFIFFEINENLGDETADCLSQAGYLNIILKKDLNGRDRMLRATKPKSSNLGLGSRA